MGSFGTGYISPGVYDTVTFVNSSAPATGTARIPVIIGEGQQFITQNNIELFRGSSASQDDQAVNENISNQVTGLTRNFTTTYTPVVDGTGHGIVTNNPALIQVMSTDSSGNTVPVTVISLNGATGAFSTQEIIPQGTNLTVTYYFARTDTLITNENMAYQIPSFATLTVTGTSSSSIVLTTTLPGSTGNLISLALVDPGSGLGVVDALAVTGAGTDTISINIRTATNAFRTVADLGTLVAAGIPTLDAGYLAVKTTAVGSGNLVATAAANFAGGAGPSSNTTFKVINTPITDGTNGGIVTTNPTDVTVLVNGNAASVAALNGLDGLVTLTNPVAYGSTLTITYYTNTWQNTFDLLPNENVASVTLVGLGPNRNDFIQGTDYVLGVDADGNGTINWGASVNITGGVDSAGDTPFGPSEMNATLVDEHVFLRAATGSVNGKNSVFTLADVPVTGSGLGTPTNNPNLISVYVGANPVEALQAGAVPVSQLNGASATVTLYNPPATGSGNVYASYWRNTLVDNLYTVTVVNSGIPGEGSYTLSDSLGRTLPTVTWNSTSSSVTESGFAEAGIIWPYNFPDLRDDAGAPNETVTFTFQDDGLNFIEQPSTQATVTVQDILFKATTPGPGPNGLTTIKFIGVYSVLPNFAIATLTNITSWTWVASTAYTKGTIVNDGTHLQVVATAGTSGTGTPTWNHSGSTTTDGGVTWQDLGINPTVEQVFAFIVNASGTTLTTAQVVALFTGGVATTPQAGAIIATGGSSATAVTSVNQLAGGTAALTAPYADRFLVTSSLAISGTGGAQTPATPNLTVTTTWSSSTIVYLGYLITDSNGNIQKATTAGTTGSGVHPTWNTTPGQTTVDNTVTWTCLGPNAGVGTDCWLGQTYVDVLTGFKATIVDPATALSFGFTVLPTQYKYQPGDTLVFNVNASTPRLTGTTYTPSGTTQPNNLTAIPGLNTEVITTFGSAANDTALIQTFNQSGNSPNIGEYYYVTYNVNKTAAQMALTLYTSPADAYAQYGQPSTVNRVSLGVQLMTLNGAQTFGVIQVPVQPGTNTAADSDYISALAQLTANLPGSTRKADVVVPLSNSPNVHQALSRQLLVQAGPRYKGEAIGFVGYSQFTTPNVARANARGLASSRMIAIGNPVAGVEITNSSTGVAVEYAVDGPFMAAALAGLNCNPSNDVATTLTAQNLVGFSRLLITYDNATMDLMAADGLTLLLNNNGALYVRHYKSTDPSTILTSEPTCQTISDYVAQAFRADGQQFIGRKLIDSLVTDVSVVYNARMASLIANNIITGYNDLTVTPDSSDPTTVDVSVNFRPMFSLLYINISFSVVTSLS
jgi:hypothetical protein